MPRSRLRSSGRRGVGPNLSFRRWPKNTFRCSKRSIPNIKIKQGGVPYPRYEETMLTRLEGGAAPDMTRAADAMYFLFKDRGYLAPLDDYFDIGKYKDDLVAAQQMVVDDGKSYGLIEGFYPYALIYNKGMLADAGITEPPKTPQEFLEAAKKLTKGRNSTAMAPATPWPSNRAGGTRCRSGSPLSMPSGRRTASRR